MAEQYLPARPGPARLAGRGQAGSAGMQIRTIGPPPNARTHTHARIHGHTGARARAVWRRESAPKGVSVCV
jgi:hypothetical protein